jgi:hypothetical protein
LTTDAAVAKAAQEVPDTDDPALLARAKQATAYYSNHALPNPFAGLSRDKLTDIIYDNSGAYTTNERCAAMSEQSDQDFKYWSDVFAQDAASGGDHRALYQATLDYYDKLSPMERAYNNYPPNYRSSIEERLKEEEEKENGPFHSLLAVSAPISETTESMAMPPTASDSAGPGNNFVPKNNENPATSDTLLEKKYATWPQMLEKLVNLA